jgi:hypothetical protein
VPFIFTSAIRDEIEQIFRRFVIRLHPEVVEYCAVDDDTVQLRFKCFVQIHQNVTFIVFFDIIKGVVNPKGVEWHRLMDRTRKQINKRNS